MATNYFPLIANATANTINELPSGDNLNLAGSNIVNAQSIYANVDITAVGNITAGNANVSGNITTGSGTGGNISGANVISANTGNFSANVTASYF